MVTNRSFSPKPFRGLKIREKVLSHAGKLTVYATTIYRRKTVMVTNRSLFAQAFQGFKNQTKGLVSRRKINYIRNNNIQKKNCDGDKSFHFRPSLSGV